MPPYRRRTQEDVPQAPTKHSTGSNYGVAGLSGVALAGVAYAAIAACALFAMIALACTKRLDLPIYLSQPASSERRHSLCDGDLFTVNPKQEYLIGQAFSDLGLRPGEVLTQSLFSDGESDEITIILVKKVQDRTCGSICYCFAVEHHSSSRDRETDFSTSVAPWPSFVLYDRPTIFRVVQVLIAGTFNGLHDDVRQSRR